MKAFPSEDIVETLRNFETSDELPTLSSLGMKWNISQDYFTFTSERMDKPNTRREMLSVVHSIWDPMGFLSPYVLTGRQLLREIDTTAKEHNLVLEWDDPLPATMLRKWTDWNDDFKYLPDTRVTRCYYGKQTIRRASSHLIGFSDASSYAVRICIYLYQLFEDGTSISALVFAQSHLAPKSATSVPRLELCAAVLLAEAMRKIHQELEMTINHLSFFTDSKIVLGYIFNTTRRFYTYVANRVQRILDLSHPYQCFLSVGRTSPTSRVEHRL